MPIPLLDLRAQYASLKDEIRPAIDAVLESGHYALGPAVEAFEKDFAAYCGVAHCVGLNSGTAAIALLLQAHGIGPGDEVITAANSFFASAEGISEIGAVPVLADCDPETALIDPASVERAITPKTKAILAVHLYGQPADMEALRAITKPRGLLLLEDAAQAQGSLLRGKRAGGLADGACFSFYPGKNLGAYGEAGAICTPDPDIAARVRMLREHGSAKKYHHDVVGWNERMDALQGAVLGVKLRHLEHWNAARRAHAETYRKLLPAAAKPIAQADGTDTNRHLFVIRVPERDRVLAALNAQGIGAAIHYPVPIHLQPAYAGRWKTGDFPRAEKLAGEILSLPLYAEMTEEQVEEVCGALGTALA